MRKSVAVSILLLFILPVNLAIATNSLDSFVLKCITQNELSGNIKITDVFKITPKSNTSEFISVSPKIVGRLIVKEHLYFLIY